MFTLALITASAAVLTSPNLPPEELGAAFQILRKGEPIGFHIVQIEETAEGVFVDTRIEMKVKFGPIPLYKYHHVAQEIWRDGALQALSSRTDDNGEEMYLEARRDEAGLILDGDAYAGPAPKDAMPSSYWNKDFLSSAIIINTQNGELIAVETENLGETLAPSGKPAEQYRMVGTLAVDIWYDGEQWVGCNFTVEGEELTYRRVESAEEEQALLAQLD